MVFHLKISYPHDMRSFRVRLTWLANRISQSRAHDQITWEKPKCVKAWSTVSFCLHHQVTKCPILGVASEQCDWGILCATLGVSAKNSYVMNSVAIPRIPGESIGGICRLLDDKGSSLTLNVEYNQLDPLLKETPSGWWSRFFVFNRPGVSLWRILGNVYHVLRWWLAFGCCARTIPKRENDPHRSFQDRHQVK